jgi:hypothetical protein
LDLRLTGRIGLAALALAGAAIIVMHDAAPNPALAASQASRCPKLAVQKRLPPPEEVIRAAWRAAPRVLVFSNQRGRAEVSRRSSNITMVSWLGDRRAPGLERLRQTALTKCPATVVDASWAVSFEIGSAPTLFMGRATIIMMRAPSGWVAYAYRFGT